jgi:hypothetical protein
MSDNVLLQRRITLTIGRGKSASLPNRTDMLRIGAIRKLVEVMRVGFQSRGFDLDSEVDIIGCEHFSRIDRVTTQMRVGPDLVRNTNGNTLSRV